MGLKTRRIALSLGVVLALGGFGFAVGSVAPDSTVETVVATVTPDAASATEGCPDTECVDGECLAATDCGCVDTNDDGVCDTTEPCTETASCGDSDSGDGGFGDECDEPGVQCLLGCCD